MVLSVMVTPKAVPMLTPLSTFAGSVPKNLGQLLRETPIKLFVTVLQTRQEKLNVFMMPTLSQPGLMRHNIVHAFSNGINDQNCRKTLPSYFCPWSRISVVSAIVIKFCEFESSSYDIMSYKSFWPLCTKNSSLLKPITVQSALLFQSSPSISNSDMPSPFWIAHLLQNSLNAHPMTTTA